MSAGVVRTYYDITRTKLRYEYFQINGKKEGVFRCYFEDDNMCKNFPGQLKIVCNYINDVREGEYKEFFKNGQLKIICNYINGKIEGEYKSSFADYPIGQFQIICNYINNKKEGEYKEFHENGQLSVICNYINNKKEGYYNKFHDNGQLCSICNYINNKKRRRIYRIL